MAIPGSGLSGGILLAYNHSISLCNISMTQRWIMEDLMLRILLSPSLALMVSLKKKINVLFLSNSHRWTMVIVGSVW